MLRKLTITTLVVAAAFAGANGVLADSAQPATMTDFFRMEDQVFQEHLFASYQRSKHADAKWAAPMKKLAEGAALTHHQRHDRMETSRLDTQAVELLQAGCDSVAVPLVRGIAQEDLERSDDALSIYDRVIKRVREGEYLHPGIASQVAARAALLQTNRKKQDEAKALFSFAADQFIALARETPRDVNNQRILVKTLDRLLRGDLPGEYASRIVEGLDSDGDDALDLCTRETIAGMVDEHLGWEARGGGFAPTVTDEGWKQF